MGLMNLLLLFGHTLILGNLVGWKKKIKSLEEKKLRGWDKDDALYNKLRIGILAKLDDIDKNIEILLMIDKTKRRLRAQLWRLLKQEEIK